MSKPTKYASLTFTALLVTFFGPYLHWPSLYEGIGLIAFQTILSVQFSALVWFCLRHRENQPIAIDNSDTAQQFKSHARSDRTTKVYFWCLISSLPVLTFLSQLPPHSIIIVALSVYGAHRVLSSYTLVSATADDKTALMVEAQHKGWYASPAVAVHYKKKYDSGLYLRRYQQKDELLVLINQLVPAPIQTVSISSHVLLDGMQTWMLKQLNKENIPHSHIRKFCLIRDVQIIFYILIGALFGQVEFKGLLRKLPKPWKRKIFIDIHIDQMRERQQLSVI